MTLVNLMKSDHYCLTMPMEMENRCPPGFKIDNVAFGGDQRTVTYIALHDHVAVDPADFIVDKDDHEQVFESYRSALSEFIEYRNHLIGRGNTPHDDRLDT